MGMRVGRILTDAERARRVAAEDAAGWAGEQLRSAFAISAGHVLTAWHCVRDLLDGGEPLWFRLRATWPTRPISTPRSLTFAPRSMTRPARSDATVTRS